MEIGKDNSATPSASDILLQWQELQKEWQAENESRRFNLPERTLGLEDAVRMLYDDLQATMWFLDKALKILAASESSASGGAEADAALLVERFGGAGWVNQASMWAWLAARGCTEGGILARDNKTDGEYHRRWHRAADSFELNANWYSALTFEPLIRWALSRPLTPGTELPTSDPMTNEKAKEPLTSPVLLGLGLYVIETRGRNRDKDLGPWKPACAFVSEHEAEWYHGRFESNGYMRILRPNVEVSDRLS